MGQEGPFDGAKVALFIGDALAVILRDDTPGLPWRGCWDLPGGGREGTESAWDCAARECREELGLRVPRDAVVWSRAYRDRGRLRWFFVARQPGEAAAQVRLGDEGQCWRLMPLEDYLSHPNAITPHQARLRDYVLECQVFDLEKKGPPLP